MDTCFDVFLQQKPVGTVILRKQGLYYQLECLCPVPMPERCDLVLVCDGKEMNLGICVPYAKGFGLKTRMKTAAIGEGDIRFVLSPKDLPRKTEFYPVFEDKPFESIERLEYAHLQIRGGQPGIVFYDQSDIDSSKPTGQ